MYPEVELLDHTAVLFLILRKLHTTFYSASTNLHSYQQCMGSLFSASMLAFVISCLFDDDHSNRCEVIYYCGFNLHFPNEWQC